MLTIQNLSFYFGGRPLYEEASLHIRPKDRIGLIGANGTGKSTLLRLISGEYTPDKGTISKNSGCTIGFLNQDLLSYQSQDSILVVAMQAFERAMYLQKQIDIVLHEMENNYADELVEKLANLQEEFQSLDGYSLQYRAESVLEGLGFATHLLHKPLSEFSGGWRMRVMLAKLLLQNPSLLMLDEPTNHLDLPSIQWIEDYLKTYEGAIIIVSHDKEFLNNTATATVEVAQYKLNYYAGDYAYYVREKALRRENQQAAYENQQTKIKQTERFVERFKAKASKAKQVQSRVKSLQRMDLVEEITDENAQVNFKFKFTQASGRAVINLENISKAYDHLTILKNTTATIQRGDKIALIGANGKGKSTLLRIIGGEEKFDGKREVGHNVREAFFAQHQLESLNVENTILEELAQHGTDKTEGELRSILGCFLFTSDDVFKKIKVLSGGEKSRVALAKTLITEANFLLLDEPTNHLDMQSVNILTQALQQYEGTFVVVSHDRFFFSQVANKIWYIEDFEIKEYIGTFEEYEIWRQKRLQEQKVNAEVKPVKSVVQTPKNISPSDEEIKNLKKLQKSLNEVEEELEVLEKKGKNIEQQLSLPEVFADTAKLAQLTKEYEGIKKSLKQKEDTWNDTAQQIEKLEARVKA